MTNQREDIEKPTMPCGKNPGVLHIFIPLLILFILLLGFIGYLAVSPGSISDFKPQVDNATKYLIDTNPQSTNNSPLVISKWILILLATFGALQTFPILYASHKTKKKRLSQKDKREIIFLCEMPMYLGLLGSLLGVCLTQFMTGTLSAPLAYITTITGILLHLFAKFTIIVPLPETSTPDLVEEV
ncbi:MAG: hypothetical protein HON76_21005 [Candidatus Scalindua sp.]|nr:hypothetical protein [Candidatus Scalindua sp.]MBT5307485.1 hypothetical protein [Candidatus Scalindua sp.]MBT6046117.1 hypothetical protein [Candidatus Scalindua sp.]MBT6225134.1 hypothetical protein [Candidatus Scalindua sp.]MBT6565000.1 hypothetical protein [Candidatus Scalindua sp.]